MDKIRQLDICLKIIITISTRAEVIKNTFALPVIEEGFDDLPYK